MSRYENINAETVTEMKDLIAALNKRFDQLYKKIDGVEGDVKSIISDMDKLKAHFGIK